MLELLSFEETRVIGSLIEKKLTTPEYYPLTVNALKNACNQKSNRYPVVSFETELIENILNKLKDRSLVSRITGDDMRVPKFKEIFTEKYNLSLSEVAVMCILMLRGPQTPGEIKSRTERLFSFKSLMHVDEVLQKLMNQEEPMIFKIPKQLGNKESRYAHLFSVPKNIEVPDENEEHINEYDERILRLEEELKSVKIELDEVRGQFNEFKRELGL
jgi:uncharacterized protein YceH (UPF0502 family)